MDEARRQIITDALREAGLEDVALWVEQPDAVRELLSMSIYGLDGDRCASCGTPEGDPHNRACLVLTAWQALGDRRAEYDYQLAWSAALAVNARRRIMVDWQRHLYQPREVMFGAVAHESCHHTRTARVVLGDGVTSVERCLACDTIIYGVRDGARTATIRTGIEEDSCADCGEVFTGFHACAGRAT